MSDSNEWEGGDSDTQFMVVWQNSVGLHRGDSMEIHIDWCIRTCVMHQKL